MTDSYEEEFEKYLEYLKESNVPENIIDLIKKNKPLAIKIAKLSEARNAILNNGLTDPFKEESYEEELEDEDYFNDIYEKFPSQKPIREASGEYNDDSLFVAVLYTIMRDHLSTGVVENIVQDILNAGGYDGPIAYTNGWLAQYARNIVDRLEEK